MTTIAQLQANKEKLKAQRAQADLEVLLDSTCTRDQWRVDAVALEALAMAALDDLAEVMLEALDNAEHENAAHHAMTDSSIGVMKRLAEQVREQAQQKWAGQAMGRSVKPRELLTVSKHADKHRVIKTGSASPGPWRTELTPYLRDIMDDLSEHSPVRRVSFMKASGLGGSEVLFNWMSYLIEHVRNKDAMLVVPTLDLRDRTFNPKLNKLFKETEVLTDLVSSSSRDKSNSASVTSFGDSARLIKSGANSPDSFRADHLPYAALDEVDAYPWDVGEEGDPLELIDNRQRTYTRAKTYSVSTPTLDLLSKIQILYLSGDQRQYHVHCPHCGYRQTLEFSHLQFDLEPGTENDGPDAVVSHAFMVCQSSDCAAPIEENHKTAMLAGGLWIAQRPHIKDHRSYQLNSLYAPIGLGLTWRTIAQKKVAAEKDTAKQKVFRNTYEGLTWKEEGDGVDETSLQARVENYSLNDLIEKCLITKITGGADIQKNRIEASYVAWNNKEEAWLLAHRIYPGDPLDDGPWDAMYEDCAELSVSVLGVDSGYLTSRVIEKTESKNWAIPTKGMPGLARPIVDDAETRVKRLRKRARHKHAIEPVGVDAAKVVVTKRLQLEAPGGGFVHFPNDTDFDDEYFLQLAAEQLVTRVRNGRRRQEWVQLRARNEALDCFVYALAALRILADMPFLRRKIKIVKQVERTALPGTTQAEKPQPQPETKQAKAVPRRRRTVTSSYARR